MTLTVHAFIEPRNGSFVATCLEMGLVATADSADELPGIMEKLISRQVKFALENGNPADLFRPASPDVWERFRKATEKQKRQEAWKTERPISVINWPNLSLSQIAYASSHC
jgi:hypothetical protein